jgi:hypothetical protein
VADENKEDKQTSGTKDITSQTAFSRIFSRSKQIDDAVDAALGRMKEGQSTDSNNN